MNYFNKIIILICYFFFDIISKTLLLLIVSAIMTPIKEIRAKILKALSKMGKAFELDNT